MTHVISRVLAAFIGVTALASPGAFPVHATGPEQPPAGAAAAAGVPAAVARWTIEAASGSVRYGDAAGGGAPAAPGDVLLGATSTVETGPDGRVTLVRGGDTVAVDPGSRLRVAPADADGLGAHIRQTWGRLLFNVEAVPGRSFTVETPRLVAGVAPAGSTGGAKFSAEVSAAGDAVSVYEGTVWVRRTGGGPTVEVRAGEMVRMAENGTGGIRVSGAVFPDGGDATAASGRGPGPFSRGSSRSHGPRSPLSYTLSDLFGDVFGHSAPSPAEVAVVTLVASAAATVLPRTATALAALAGVLWWVAPAYVVGAVLMTVALARMMLSGLRRRGQRQQRPAPEGRGRAW